MKKQTSKWITISEEDSIISSEKVPSADSKNWLTKIKEWLDGDIELKKSQPDPSRFVKKQNKQNQPVLNVGQVLAKDAEEVTHKWFWATGFVVIMVLSALLLAPDEFSAQMKRLIPGNLFNDTIKNYDGVDFIPEDFAETSSLQVIPPQPGSQAEQEVQEVVQQEALDQQAQQNQVVDANTNAVDVVVDPVAVQVEPIEATDSNEESQVTTPEASTVEDTADLSPAAPEEGMGEDLEATEVEPVEEDDAVQEAALSAQQALIEQLNQELQAFQQQSEQQAQQLSGEQNLNPAAGDDPNTGLQTTQILGQQPSITATQGGQTTTAPPMPSLTSNLNTTPPVAQPTTTYRLNPYKVTLTPQQVLAQNQGKIAANQAASQTLEVNEFHMAQANVATANAQLGQVQATPESGPMDLVWVALALALFVGFRTLRTCL